MSRRDQEHAGERGQALLEFALVAPILIILVMAVFQFAYVFESQLGLTNAVREAARRAAATVNPTDVWVRAELCGSDPTACATGLLRDNVQAFDPSRLVPSTGPNPNPRIEFCSYLVGTGTITNYRVTVSVNYQHPVFFGPLAFATDLADGSGDGDWTIGASAQMRLERGQPNPAPQPCT